MINRVELCGNLTRDVETRQTKSGGNVFNMGLAVNDRRRNAAGEWEDYPCFVDLTMFDTNNTRGWMLPYLTKGTKVMIDGVLRYDTWEDKDTGKNRSKLYVVVNNIEANWPPKQQGGYQQQRQQPQRQQRRPQQQRPQQQQWDYEDEEDSIPF